MRSEQGSALVETGMAMLSLMMLIFAVIEVSMAVYSFHFVANAAHEAARYAIVRGSGWSAACSSWTSAQCTASPTNIQTYTASRNFPGVNIAASKVCVEYFSSVPASASTACTASTSPYSNASGDIVQVTVTYPFTITIPLLPQYTINLKSTSQMTIAQ